ncbi:MAG: hypothetical protein J0L97_01130 [Alphaproteobacteria bacterium]|nr:hypothetical protein [Alphaproteobacteria bacterium]
MQALKVFKIIGIVIGTMISIAAILLAGYGMHLVYYFHDNIHAGNLRAAKDREVHVTALRQVTPIAPVTRAQRERMAELGKGLITEIEVTSASLLHTDGYDDVVLSKRTAISHALKLLETLGTIAEDGRLTGAEYKAWNDFHKARHLDDSPQQTAFDRFFKHAPGDDEKNNN